MIAGGVCVLFGIFLAIRHAMSKGDESKVKESKEAWKNFYYRVHWHFLLL